MTKFCFSRRISKVNFVVNLLLITMAVVVCSMRWLQTEFCSLPSRTLGSELAMTLSFLVFVNVTRLEIGS